jgi:hypothetical protein
MSFLLIVLLTIAQGDIPTEQYDIDAIYKKVDLDSGTLDDDGEDIDHIFVQTELKEGKYEIEITDGPGELYEVKGTDLYLKFRSYYGYAGYGDEGLLIIGSSSWSSEFIKYED